MLSGLSDQKRLYAEIDLQETGTARRTFDVAAHYAKPDIFTLHVDTREQGPIVFDVGLISLLFQPQ